MVERIYLDSSVYVKLFYPEDGSDTAEEVLSRVKTNRKFKIYLSYWVINESVAAIDKMHYKLRIITEEQRDTIIATIFKSLIEYSKLDVIVTSVNHSLVRNSVNYIYRYNLSADDAFHIHVANELKCKYFITNDNHIKRQIGDSLGGLRILKITNKSEMSDLLAMISLQ